MDQNGRPPVQVVINSHPSSHLQPLQQSGPNMSLQQSRSLSVDEALQYSSMSSAPIFGVGQSTPNSHTYHPKYPSNAWITADCILHPDVGRPSNTTSINHVLQAGRNTLRELDAEIQSGQDESSRLETSREYLQQLLDGDQLTEL